MKRLEVSGAVRPIYGSLGVKRLTIRYAVWWVVSEVSVQTTASIRWVQ